MANPREEVMIDYTNWRGVRSHRRIRPIRIAYENSEWHPETQWILHAVDIEKNLAREFAIKDIHAWIPMLVSA